MSLLIGEERWSLPVYRMVIINGVVHRTRIITFHAFGRQYTKEIPDGWTIAGPGANIDPEDLSGYNGVGDIYLQSPDLREKDSTKYWYGCDSEGREVNHGPRNYWTNDSWRVIRPIKNEVVTFPLSGHRPESSPYWLWVDKVLGDKDCPIKDKLKLTRLALRQARQAGLPTLTERLHICALAYTFDLGRETEKQANNGGKS